jgi:glycosyltransferase involved in cell wall biosynthesis
LAPEITVIIPSYNSANSLEYCLRSIREQGMDVEIIVSDRQSKDGTPEVVKRYGGRLISKDCERAEAKNVALREAQGRYVLFMDADMELTPGVLMQCLYAAEKPQVGGVIISERSVGDSFWVKVRDHERLFYAGTDIESARFFPRSLALEAGGFSSEVVFFEESVLPQKIKAMGYSIDERIEAPRAVARILATAEGRERELVGRLMAGWEPAEIAQAEGRSHGAVRSQICRLRARLAAETRQ